MKRCGGMKWHASQRRLVATEKGALCKPPLPVAVVPLWQLAQLPNTWLWSTRLVAQVVVEVWQASHTGGSSLIRMWLAERVVAWQPTSLHAALVSVWFI